MKRQSAFTLIELLVVIAIIAILAAILFPVFAQAKISAKKTASISNMKQHSLGIVMYATDYDDMFPRHAYVNVGGAFPNDVVYWPRLAEPYTKNWPLFRDPMQMVDFAGIWNGGNPGIKWWYNWMRWPDYGYNATYLNNDSDCTHWQALGWGPPVSATTPEKPAETIMLTTTKVVNNGASAYTSQVNEAPASILIDDACTWSNGGWGTGSWGDSVGALTYPGNPTYTGPNAINYMQGTNASFTDSHVKYLKPGAMAAGTNWRVGLANTQIALTDRERYIWDLK